MKLLSPKSVSISLATVALAFIGGMALASQPRPIVHPALKTAADTSISTDIVPESQPSVTSSETSDPSSPSAPDSTQSTDSTPVSTDTTTDTPQAPADDPAPAVVAVSAELAPWTTPVPMPNMHPAGSTVSYEYCVWTYSDGTTQQKMYRNTEYDASGTVIGFGGSNFDCTIADAPVAN